MRLLVTLALVAVTSPTSALAQPADDGYCDYVEGTASATAAPLFAPEVFGQFGNVEQLPFAVTPSEDTSNLRALAGVRYSLTNIYAGMATKSRASAECRRHRALIAVRGATAARALTARVRVLDEARAEADRILAATQADLEANRTTLPEATATRMRVEELRTLAANARRDLAALPSADTRPLGTLLAEFRSADADVERGEAKLRSIKAYDVNVRVGADRYLQGPDQDTQYFAVVELGVNLGALWVGKGNDRAAAGRKRYVRSGNDPLGLDTPLEQLRALVELETKRIDQTAALVADLDRQLQALASMTSEDSKRFRQTVWFDWVKAKADLAYLQAHVQALREVIAAQ